MKISTFLFAITLILAASCIGIDAKKKNEKVTICSKYILYDVYVLYTLGIFN